MSRYPSLDAIVASTKAPPQPTLAPLDTDGDAMDINLDPDFDPSLMSPVALSTSAHHRTEVSMVEKMQDVGVTFTPALSLQRQEWALDVLRREGATSVLEIGCGQGELLRALCRPAPTVPERAITERADDVEQQSTDVRRASPNGRGSERRRKPPVNGQQNGRSTSRSRSRPRYGHRQRSMSADDDIAGRMDEDHAGANGAANGASAQPKEVRELFLNRVAGLDIDPAVIPKAVAATAPPAESSQNGSADDSMQVDQSYVPPRWQRLEVEIWQGGLERHNHRLEGFEAIVATEVIEHLDEPSMDIFPQMVFGTLRPRIVLITTPNFEFNSKFPRAMENDESHQHVKKGFLDPSKRTERVFRHSDHKFEMTEKEFAQWCDGAEDWGYSCTIGGIGISSQPSYHDGDKLRPLYATHTAVFTLECNPTRSPRSKRTATLPFMPGGGEALHPHRLAARQIHELRGIGRSIKQQDFKPQAPAEIRQLVSEVMARWEVASVSIQELWGSEDVALQCAGSKRALLSALGGWGNVKGEQQDQFAVEWSDAQHGTLSVRRLAAQ